MKNTPIVIDNQYLAAINLFSILNKSSNIIFEQYETYQKMSFRNRCLIAGANGVISLSISLEKGRSQKKLITDVKISNRTNWQEQHWRTIESCYRGSPWFVYYGPELRQFYYRKFEYLFDWNLELFKWAISKLNFPIPVEIGFTNNFQHLYDDAFFIDLRNKILPKNYHLTPTKPYQQVFKERTGFIPNLSIIDLLFCEGKRALNYL